MFTELYIEALIFDEELADLVCEAWDQEKIGVIGACIAWLRVIAQV